MVVIRYIAAGVATFALVALTLIGCSPGGRRSDLSSIRVTGSDTMVNLAAAWKEAFELSYADYSVAIKGGGSGVGIAALCDGKIDIATSSRTMSAEEIETAKQKSGKEPVLHKVGMDALAIYLHNNNPLESISIPELTEVYGENGAISTWKQLGVENTACPSGEIILVSRQNSSGTYLYFQEAVLGKGRDFKQGMTSQSGSADIVSLISKTPCAIGYSGMGYKKPEVKFAKVSKEKGEPGILPTVESALDGTYPISRPLYLYTLGEPSGAVLEFIQWAQGDEGQRIVADEGYVPLPPEERTR